MENRDNMNNTIIPATQFEVFETHEIDELDLDFGACGIAFCGKGQD